MERCDREIRLMLEQLQYAYAQRDPANLDGLCRTMFADDAEPVIIGTGTDEWCFGFSEARELFLSDWKYWGDFVLHPETLACERVGSRSWFALRAGVTYRFEDSDERDARYLGFVREAAAGDGPALAKAGEVLWLTSHLLSRRPEGIRAYSWHVTLSGMLEDTPSGPKARVLQFSLPVAARYSDERMGESGAEWDKFRNVGNLIARWSSRLCTSGEAWRERLSLWHAKDAPVEWVRDGQARFIGLDGARRDGETFCAYVRALRADYEIAVQPDHIAVDESDGVTIFYGIGFFTQRMTLEHELERVLDRIRSCDYEGCAGDVLFRIRRDLSQTLKEAGAGEVRRAAFRFEGMARLEGEKLYMHYFQLSYPFTRYLEQKTDLSDPMDA